jgi:hypothetical protein
VTLEINPDYAQVARANFERAGLAGKIELRLGPAIETLPKLSAEDHPPFDLVFIDADKASTPEYFAWALKLSRPGTIIMVDNVVRNGAVTDATSTDPSVQGGAPILRTVRSRTTRQCNGAADRWQQRLRRLCAVNRGKLTCLMPLITERVKAARAGENPQGYCPFDIRLGSDGGCAIPKRLLPAPARSRRSQSE